MLVLWTCLIGVATAAPLASLERTLEQPIASRVELLRRQGRRGYADLARVAFDAQAPLRTRWRAVTTMSRLDPAYFRAALDRAPISPEWFLRNAALIAALSDTRERAAQASLKGLDDPALIVRTQAVRNLIHLDARASEPRLWRELNDARNFAARRESLWVRAHIAEALAKFAGPGRARDFGQMLLDRDVRLHKWAIRGLEASTGLRLTERGEAPEAARAKWLARLGLESI